MKIVKYIAFVIVLALLTGCSTTFRPWKLSEVQEGMDKDQVIQILGEPDSVDVKDGVELLQYTYSEDYNPSSATSDIDSPGADIQKWEVKRSFKEYKYIVELVDGKVLTYKEVQD